jgi:A/G-specific adenine glycosylase
MLQQTQVSTVEPYFRRWLRLFPTVNALADAEEQAVLHAWEGLGYYSRARALLRGAREVMSLHAGQLPNSAAGLLKLPGIGPYTAGAIASIAYEQDEPIVDGNVIRVLTRLYALAGDPQKSPLKDQLWVLSRRLIPPGQARDFNQALMELGALVCTPKKVRCTECPLRRDCRAFALDAVARFPETASRPKLTDVYVSAALAQRGDRVLVMQLGLDAPRWASMWQFPNLESPQPTLEAAGKSPAKGRPPSEQSRAELAAQALHFHTGLQAAPGEQLLQLRHAVTRYRVHLALYPCHGPKGRLQPSHCAQARWVSLSDLPALAMPAAHRRLAQSISGDTLSA